LGYCGHCHAREASESCAPIMEHSKRCYVADTIDAGARRRLAIDLGNPTGLLHLSVDAPAGR